MANKTVLFNKHLESNGKMVDFHGWDMPLNYGSQIEEHHAVRQDAGMFDVSHMTVVDVIGDDACAFLRKLLANDVAKLKVPGKALYGGMLDHNGGVIDDLSTYYLSDTEYRIVVNSATREKDLAWINEQVNGFRVEVTERPELEMIAAELGLTYHHIPLTQITQDAVDASTKAYAECPRPVAAFCASGTRSTVMWCFAHVREQGVDAVLAAAAQAGYQLEQTRGLLTAYAGHDKA